MTRRVPTAIQRVTALSVDDPKTGCVIFTGSLDRHGYGQVMDHYANKRAHRVAYEAARGPIPKGLTIDHLCRNRACVNPDHLEAVTKRVNTLRGIGPTARHAEKTACHRGHPFTAENTRVRAGRGRACRTCERDRDRDRTARRRPRWSKQ